MSRTATRTRTRPHHLMPDAAAWIDIAFVLALTATVLSGLGASFTGHSYLVVGMVGALMAVVVTHVCKALGWPLIAPFVVLLGLFMVLGGPIALRSLGNTAFLPSRATLSTLTDQAVFGWKDFLTTLPPVDGTGTLLVLPLVIGIVVAYAGMASSRVHLKSAWLSAALPVALLTLALVGVLLLGVRHPASLLLQGGVFAALALGWLALRTRRLSAVVHGGSTGWGRLAVGAALIVTAAGLAIPASALVGADDEGRTVARNWIEPPFEIGRYPSPLAGFRKYVDPKGSAVKGNVYDEVLFSVSGAEAGTRFRLAALDTYDGMVWGASDDPLPDESGDSFQRVSSTIDNPVDGSEVEATVTIGAGMNGVWLPTAGSLQSLQFDVGDARTKAESFRYNLATSTAVVPTGVNPGDVYHFTAVEPDDSFDATVRTAMSSSPAPADTTFLDGPVEQWTEGATVDAERVLRIANHLKTEGKYSDGVVKAERHYYPGHSLSRLDPQFIAQRVMVGNDEQYAAVLALMAQKMGLQARVVVGAVLPESGIVKGSDVEAWVEVRAADGSWRTIGTEEFVPTEPPTENQPETNEPMTGTVVPPPNPIPPPSDAGDLSAADLKKRDVEGSDADAADDGFSLPAWVSVVLTYVGLPLLLIGLIVGAILGLKMLRRSRRRNATSASARFVGGWWELVDHARDLGHAVPLAVGATRRDQASGIASGGAAVLARRADSSVFGPTSPDGASAREFWESVEAERRQMSAAVPWHRRLRAALNLTTLRPTLGRQRTKELADVAGTGAESGRKRSGQKGSGQNSSENSGRLGFARRGTGGRRAR